MQVADQPATLTMEPTVVLFGDTRHAHNAPDLRLTTQIRHQRSEQSLVSGTPDVLPNVAATAPLMLTAQPDRHLLIAKLTF